MLGRVLRGVMQDNFGPLTVYFYLFIFLFFFMCLYYSEARSVSSQKT